MYYANYDEDLIDRNRCVLIDFVCAPSALVEALGYEMGNIKRNDAADVNAVLNKLEGWERATRRSKAYGLQRGYARSVNDLLTE